MTSPLFLVALAVVRAWTWLYTARLDPCHRDRRRAEIECDLRELRHDPAGDRGVSPAVQVLARVLLGVPDDLGWRADHRMVDVDPRRRVAALTATLAAIVAVSLWVFATTQPVTLPKLPGNPIPAWGPASWGYLPPPPPPPPPPPLPCQPVALTAGCRQGNF